MSLKIFSYDQDFGPSYTNNLKEADEYYQEDQDQLPTYLTSNALKETDEDRDGADEEDLENHELPVVLIPRFEDLKVTTTTLILKLHGQVDPFSAFHVLPITRINLPIKRNSIKCKLPYCEVPGAILSMKHMGSVRGVIRSVKKSFKNSVTIDISTSKKNISVKLCEFGMHICGAKSKEDGTEAAELIIKHLKRTQMYLNKMAENKNLTLETIQWLKENTLGIPVERESYENVGSLRVRRVKEDHTIIRPEKLVPSHFNYEVTSFLFSLCDDFIYHSDLCIKLGLMPTLTQIISKKLEIASIDAAMVNYNFKLGFIIDRERLDRFIDGKNGFVSRYNNENATCVTVEFPYEPEENSNIKRKKYTIPKYSFMNYKSGSVTYSANDSKLAEQVYYLFMQTIAEIRPYIELQC